MDTGHHGQGLSPSRYLGIPVVCYHCEACVSGVSREGMKQVTSSPQTLGRSRGVCPHQAIFAPLGSSLSRGVRADGFGNIVLGDVIARVGAAEVTSVEDLVSFVESFQVGGCGGED